MQEFTQEWKDLVLWLKNGTGLTIEEIYEAVQRYQQMDLFKSRDGVVS